jgi:hypothetical protein
VDEFKFIQLKLIEMPSFTSAGKIKMYCEDKEIFSKARKLFDYEIDRRGIGNSRTETSLELYASDGTIEELQKLSRKLDSTSFTRTLEELIRQIGEYKKSIPPVWRSQNVQHAFGAALQRVQYPLQPQRISEPQHLSQREQTHHVYIQHPEQYHQYNTMPKWPQPQSMAKQGVPQFQEQKNFVHLTELLESRQNAFSMPLSQPPQPFMVFPYQQPLQGQYSYGGYNAITVHYQVSHHQRNRMSEWPLSQVPKSSYSIEFWQQQQNVRPEGSVQQYSLSPLSCKKSNCF